MPFGDHLRAQQDIDVTAMNRVEGCLRAALATRRVGINPHHPRFRKCLLQVLFNTLRTSTERLQIDIAASRTR
jgi:hypothetical protein